MKRLLALLAAQLVISLTAGAAESQSVPEALVGIVNRTEQQIVTVSFEGLKAGDNYAVKGCCTQIQWYILGPSYNSDGVPYVCCTSLPDKWQPDMKVVVRWRRGSANTKSQALLNMEKIVPVEKYDSPSGVYLHFFQNDEVRVVVSRYPPQHSAHPISPPKEE